MFLAKITFGSDGGHAHRRYDLTDKATRYLSMLLKNGQIYPEYQLAWIKRTLIVYAYVPRPDALAQRYHSEWVQTDFNKVVEAFGKSPSDKILDDVIPAAFSPWQRSTSFYLFTHFMAIEGALSCGNTGISIPPYLLPISQHVSERLYFWTGAYRSHDNIYFRSGELEIPAYKQIADPNSELAIEGRELCAQIEAATGKPTYYYLHRYYGRQHGEKTRPCPLCGSQWHVLEHRVNTRFQNFSFRCDPCRIVSNLNHIEIEEKYAHIGE